MEWIGADDLGDCQFICELQYAIFNCPKPELVDKPRKREDIR